MVFVSAGFIAGLFPTWLSRVLAWVLIVGSLCWHATRGWPAFLARRFENQANRSWAQSGALGQVYFGLLMGVGVLTQVATPLLYVGLAVAGTVGVGWAISCGVGFGLGRSVPAVAGAAMGMKRSPAEVFGATFQGATLFRWVGAGGTIAFAVALTEAF